MATVPVLFLYCNTDLSFDYEPFLKGWVTPTDRWLSDWWRWGGAAPDEREWTELIAPQGETMSRQRSCEVIELIAETSGPTRPTVSLWPCAAAPEDGNGSGVVADGGSMRFSPFHKHILAWDRKGESMGFFGLIGLVDRCKTAAANVSKSGEEKSTTGSALQKNMWNVQKNLHYLYRRSKMSKCSQVLQIRKSGKKIMECVEESQKWSFFLH